MLPRFPIFKILLLSPSESQCSWSQATPLDEINKCRPLLPPDDPNYRPPVDKAKQKANQAARVVEASVVQIREERQRVSKRDLLKELAGIPILPFNHSTK